MPPRTPNESFDAFLAAGNTLVGPRPSKIVGAFDITFQGGGSTIELQEGVSFTSTKLAFGAEGGTIRIEKGATIRGRLEVSAGGSIRIGAGTYLNRACDIRAGEGAAIDIGKDCLFSDVKVQTSDMHSVLEAGTGKRTNPAAGIVIEDNVWIAEEVKIAKGLRIGTGAVIAAGSLVTRSVAPFCLAGGLPAKVLKAGITWSRTLKKMDPLPAPKFKPADIPLEKEVLRHLVERREFALVEAVISAADQTSLPLFARWYLVLTRERLGKPHPDAKAMLKRILEELPGHTAAKTPLEKLGAGS